MIYVQRTYVKVSLLGSLHGAGEPGQGLQAVDRQRLNDSLNDIVLTLHYAVNLENARIEVWGGGEEGGKIQSRDAPRVDCGSGYIL